MDTAIFWYGYLFVVTPTATGNVRILRPVSCGVGNVLLEDVWRQEAIEC